MVSHHQLGLIYYEKEEYEEALVCFLKSVKYTGTNDEDKGNSLYFLGFMYRHGQGVDKDIAQAMTYFEQSVNLGNEGACYSLATVYYHGKFFPRDYAKAKYYYELGAERGSLSSMLNLGIMYDEGIGVEMDKAKAYKLFNDAAKLGDIDATYNLGIMHEYGESVPKNKGAAMRHYCEAGEYPHKEMYRIITLKRQSDVEGCPYQARSTPVIGKDIGELENYLTYQLQYNV